MNAVELIIAFAEQIGIDVHDLRAALTLVQNKQGDLTTLTTTQKGNLVAAINEVKATAASIGSDYLTSAAATTLIENALNGIIDGAPAAWNTFKEFADYVAADQTAAQAMLDALAKRVRVDAAQTFTAEEKTMGRSNIGAASAADLGDVSAFDPKGAYEVKRDAA